MNGASSVKLNRWGKQKKGELMTTGGGPVPPSGEGPPAPKGGKPAAPKLPVEEKVDKVRTPKPKGMPKEWKAKPPAGKYGSRTKNGVEEKWR